MVTPVAQHTPAQRTTVRRGTSPTHVLLIGNLHRVGDALCQACAPGEYRLCLEQDPQAGRLQALGASHNLIVLDVLDLAAGVALCRDLRHSGVRAPILLLAASGTREEVIAGLDAGADDCVVGLVGDEEVRARAGGLLRRGREMRMPVATAGSGGRCWT